MHASKGLIGENLHEQGSLAGIDLTVVERDQDRPEVTGEEMCLVHVGIRSRAGDPEHGLQLGGRQLRGPQVWRTRRHPRPIEELCDFSQHARVRGGSLPGPLSDDLGQFAVIQPVAGRWFAEVFEERPMVGIGRAGQGERFLDAKTLQRRAKTRLAETRLTPRDDLVHQPSILEHVFEDKGLLEEI